MPEPDFVQAALPLFASEEVEILEWSFDTTWKSGMKEWMEALLSEFSEANRLLGHGVHFSLLSAAWTERHQWWLEELRREMESRRYLHVSEHFGFMTAGDFHRGAPLPLPHDPALVALGRERFSILASVVPIPLGLENLALALSEQDVRQHGKFLEDIVSATDDGFLILDLHNLYCQLHNFSLSWQELLPNYPLDRVREIHVSGGSWEEAPSAPGQPIRRDTHDDAVPEEVFALVEAILPHCPKVEAVIFERLGNTLPDRASHDRYQQDYLLLKQLVSNARP